VVDQHISFNDAVQEVSNTMSTWTEICLSAGNWKGLELTKQVDTNMK
jgi:hypothetical protein